MAAPSPPELIGQSPAWTGTLERVSLAALVERPILVIGERGTGKELVAERLHFLSPRWDKPFVKVNCAALSQDLLDSELFGHEQGSFTGASKRRMGRFEQADGGTLFLDEIATASMQVQEKLLRVIEYGQFQRLGGEDALNVDVRVVAATNVDLPARAEDGRFRADLLDRLAFDVVTLAPLRARPEDIILLAQHFGERIARELEGDFPGWSRNALEMMVAHPWPGNVRELKNCAERATFRTMAAQANGAPLGPVEMSPDMLDPFNSPWRPAAEMSKRPAPTIQVIEQKSVSIAAEINAPVLPGPDASAGPVDFQQEVSVFERRMLDAALAAEKGHQRKAGERLGLSYHQMRGLLRKYNYGRTQEGENGDPSDAPARDVSTREAAK
jgi:psp operon transcriptional activator